jgi:hypothetical protein
VALQLAEDRGRSVVVLLLHIMHSGITKRLQVGQESSAQTCMCVSRRVPMACQYCTCFSVPHCWQFGVLGRALAEFPSPGVVG